MRSGPRATSAEPLREPLFQQCAGQRECRQSDDSDRKGGVDREPGTFGEVGDRLLKEDREKQHGLRTIELREPKRLPDPNYQIAQQACQPYEPEIVEMEVGVVEDDEPVGFGD